MSTPLLYDFIRTLRSKSTLIIIVLFMALAAGLVPALIGSSTRLDTSLRGAGVMYLEPDGYHYLIYTTDGFGQPIGGQNFTLLLKGPASNYIASGITNSSGYLSTVIHAPAASNYLGAVSTNSNGFLVKSVFPVTDTAMGQVTPLRMPEPYSTDPFYVLKDTKNSSKLVLGVFYAGPDGSRPSLDLYYMVLPESNLNSFNPTALNESQMQSLGHLNDYHQTYQVNIPSSQVCTNQTPPCNSQIVFGLFAENRTLVFVSQLPEEALYPPPNPPVPSNGFANQFFVQYLGIFVPLIGIAGASSSYGKDRVSGVLESVLVRPVTRRGLVVSRYLSTLLALSIGVLATTGLVDLLLFHFNGSWIDPLLVAGSALALLTELASFIALIFILSHLCKSTNALVASATGLFAILALIGSVVAIPVTILLGATPGSLVHLQVTVISYLANPAEYISAVNIYLTNNVATVNFPVQPSAYGITIISLAVAAVFWITAPLVAMLYIVTRGD